MTNPTRAEIEKLIEPKPVSDRLWYLSMTEQPLTPEQQAITHLLAQIDALREVLGRCDDAIEYNHQYALPQDLEGIVKQALAQTEHLVNKGANK